MAEASETSPRTAEDVPLPGGDFRLFVQKLAYQALMGMGVVENPLTRTRQANLAQAKTVLDDLLMLRDRTRGNLNDEEDQHLERVLGDLQRHFAELSRESS